MQKIKKYLKFWWMMSRNSFISGFHSKTAFFIFLTGKTIRFIFTLLFLFFLINGTGGLGQYSLNEVIFFFLTFSIIDVVSQFLFREVYRFRPMIINGDFDLVLVKPINALFRVLLGGADVIDFVTIPPILGLLVYFGFQLNPSFLNTVFYVLLIINSLAIATAFHIIVLCLGVLTLEADHIVWVYRDLTSLGRFPVDIYRQPLRGVLSYLIPIGVMFTFPSMALLNFLNWQGILISFFVGIAFMYLSLKFWKFAIRSYTSASS